MKKNELVRDVARELGEKKEIVRPIVNSFLNHIVMAIESGDEVLIRGFGTFKKKTRRPHIMKNLKTGKTEMSKESRFVSFKQSKKFGVYQVV